MIATETMSDAAVSLVTRFEIGFNTRDIAAPMAKLTFGTL